MELFPSPSHWQPELMLLFWQWCRTDCLYPESWLRSLAIPRGSCSVMVNMDQPDLSQSTGIENRKYLGPQRQATESPLLSRELLECRLNLALKVWLQWLLQFGARIFQISSPGLGDCRSFLYFVITSLLVLISTKVWEAVCDQFVPRCWESSYPGQARLLLTGHSVCCHWIEPC